MLVLSRKIGETIVIGEGVTLVVRRVAGSRVALGIDAPDDVRIVRGELSIDLPAVGAERAEAAAAD